MTQARQLLDALLTAEPAAEEPEIRNALQGALMTPDAALTSAQREWLAVLRR